MKVENDGSASSSAGTSDPKPSPDVPPEKLSEAQYLNQQAESAKAAMTQAWKELKTRLGQGTSPQAWAKEYPWVTVGTAAVAGFIAASSLIPSKEEQTLKKLAAIERALNPQPHAPEHSQGNGKSEPQGKSIVSTILHEVLAIARPAIVSLMTAHLGNLTGSPDDAARPDDPAQATDSP